MLSFYLYLALFRPFSHARALRQYFEEILASEQAAQDKYYEDNISNSNASNTESNGPNCIPEGKEQPEWYDILRSPSSSIRHSRSDLALGHF